MPADELHHPNSSTRPTARRHGRRDRGPHSGVPRAAGSSVDALTAKLDVKEQAKQKARETSERVQAGAQHASERVQAGAQHAYEQAYERARTTSPAVLGAVAAGVVALIVLLIALGRRSSHQS